MNETNNENKTSGWGWGCRNEEKLKAITGLVERKAKRNLDEPEQDDDMIR